MVVWLVVEFLVVWYAKEALFYQNIIIAASSSRTTATVNASWRDTVDGVDRLLDIEEMGDIGDIGHIGHIGDIGHIEHIGHMG